MKVIRIGLWISLILRYSVVMGQTESPHEWWFWPDYTLDGRAKNQIGPILETPRTPKVPIKSAAHVFSFFGKEPTERIEDFSPSEVVPTASFSLEMWINYHVNKEVGTLVAYRNRYQEGDPKWLIGISGKEVIFTKEDESALFSASIHHSIRKRGWKNYWYHIVGTFDGEEMRLYVNGKLEETVKAGSVYSYDPKNLQLEVAGYFSEEPYMQIGDLLKTVKLHNRSITEKEIRDSMKRLQSLVEEGKIYPDIFHFTAGPYLQAVTEREIGLVWETSHKSTVEIQYGTSLPLTDKVVVQKVSINEELHEVEGVTIGKYTLTGLEPGQNYFYQIIATSDDGEIIESGVSTFKTAPEEIKSFTFSTIGDTEARPHVNNRISKLIWDERPDFIINLGDLTDGGGKDYKFQWNHEYFHAMNQLVSRVPVFPVAGNGEGDLFWFKKYHILGQEKGYYKFSYANADFFMLDSNQKDEFAPKGEQYEWLEEQLAASSAEWKFVAHHHAPYSADEDDYGDSWSGASANGDLKIRKIVPLYEKYGVDVVMFGHLHTYQRTHLINENQINNEKGVMYVQAGGAGGNLEDFSPTRAWFSAKTFRGHHYLTIEVQGAKLELRMYDSQGRLKDIYAINH